MYDFFRKEAELCINYSVQVQPGEQVLIWGNTTALPLVRELFRATLRAGGHPILKLELPDQEYLLTHDGNPEQITFLSPTDVTMLETVNVGIKILADTNTQEMVALSPDQLSLNRQGKARFFGKFFERLAKQDLKWCLLPYPTDALAQEAQMSTEEYAEMIRRTLFLDHQEPAAKWKEFDTHQQKYCDFLNQRSHIRIMKPGTDLSFSTKGRRWISSAGHENLPDGEIYTGPVENSVNGTIEFDLPSTSGTITPIPKGIEHISLTFKEGVVIHAKASQGQELLDKLLQIDSGAKHVGEFAIATNPGLSSVTRRVAFDEKIKGTIHLALGNGYPLTGSQNHSQIHWDLLCDMRVSGQIYANGELIYEKGDFII